MPRQDRPHSGNRSSSSESGNYKRRRQGSRGQLGKVIATVGFMSIALLIAKQEIPQVANWIDQIADPGAWQAAEQCRKRALQASSQPAYARIVDTGKADATQNNFFVHDILVGEMGVSGSEQLFRFSCYVSNQGEVVKTSKNNLGLSADN